MAAIFSVIIPTFNRSNLLQIAIQSVIEQTFPDWELIIVDDASTDDTKEIVQKYADFRIKYHYQNKQERSTARNNGISFSTGKYICFLDDDDYFLPNHLQVFHEYNLINNFKAEILRTGYFKEVNQTRKKTINYNLKKHRNPVNFAAHNMCGVWTLSIPKQYLDQDQFHPDFPHWQDTHLILRLFAKHGMTQLKEYTYIYKIHKLMGSIKLLTETDFNERLELNIKPINQLFANYGELLKPFLPNKTQSYLLAKKYYEFANYDLFYRNGNQFWKLLQKGIALHISIKFWKIYLNIIKDFFKKKN